MTRDAPRSCAGTTWRPTGRGEPGAVAGGGRRCRPNRPVTSGAPDGTPSSRRCARPGCRDPVDTSAWVRSSATPGPSVRALDALLDDDIAITDAIRMELLAGARRGPPPSAVGGLTARTTVLATTTGLTTSSPRCSTCVSTLRARRSASSSTAPSPQSPSATTWPCCTTTATSRCWPATPSSASRPPEGGSGPDVGDEGPGIAGARRRGSRTGRAPQRSGNLERGRGRRTSGSAVTLSVASSAPSSDAVAATR